MRHLALLLAALFLSGGSLALAQPLAALAPAETFLTLGWTPGLSPDEPQTALTRDLAALDWSRAGRTLEALAPLTGDGSSENMLNLYGYLFQGRSDVPPQENDPFADCPEWQALARTYPPMPDLTLDDTFSEALLSVSAASYNPIPAVTAILRVEPTVAAQFAAIQRAIVRCSERGGTEIVRLKEGDVPLIVVGNAGDFPVVLSRVEDLFIAGTNPEVVRRVTRRATGSDEANLAQTPFYRQNQKLLSGNGMSLSLNAATLGGSVESLGGALTDATTEPLLRRAVAALRTLGSFAGRLQSGGSEVELSTRLNVDPAGGDPELAALLTCRCPAPAPTLAPETSVSVSSTHLEPRKLFAYLEGWAELAGRASGEPTSLRQLARQAGIDVDVALLDWLGNGMTSVVLEPVSADLGTLLYGQAQVLVLETRGAAAAKEGLAALGKAAQQGLEQTDLETDLADTASLTQVARETYRYRGTAINRLRFGPTTDLGTAFLGDTLLVGSPASALERVLDTEQGRAGALTDAEPFVQAQRAAPEGVTQLSYNALAPQLQGWADILRLASQPLAFAAAAGLSADSDTASEKSSSFADLLHLTELLPDALTILGDHTGALSSHIWLEGDVRRSSARLGWE